MGEKTQYSSYRWAMLVSACLAIISICVDMIAISPVLGEVAKDLNVEMGVATNLMMGFVLATASVLIWGGVVVDKFGVTVATVLGLLCATIPATLMPLIGQNYGMVMVARLIQGALARICFRNHRTDGGVVVSSQGTWSCRWNYYCLYPSRLSIGRFDFAHDSGCRVFLARCCCPSFFAWLGRYTNGSHHYPAPPITGSAPGADAGHAALQPGKLPSKRPSGYR